MVNAGALEWYAIPAPLMAFVVLLLSDKNYSLLHKLEYYDVNPQNNRWIRSFLKNRKQSVILEGTVSKQVPVLSCVPKVQFLDLYCSWPTSSTYQEQQLHPRSNYLQMTAIFTVLLTTRLTVTYCRGTLQF